MSKPEVTFDGIWTFVEEKFNEVPPYIKYILSYCGYNNGSSIATIEDDDIEHFVSEVRNGNVTNYFKAINDKTNVLEGSTKKSEDFEFRRGHLKHLMSIVKFLKKHSDENGPDSFTSTKQKKKTNTKQTVPNKSSAPRKRFKFSVNTLTVASGIENEMEKQKNILMQKMQCSLKNHTETLYAENSSKIKERMSNGQLIIVQAGESKDRNPESENTENSKEGTKVLKYTGCMICPYCSKNITVFYVSDAPRWNSSNFDRHLKLSHCSQPVNTLVNTESAVNTESEENREKSEDKSDAETKNTETTNVKTKNAPTIAENSDVEAIDIETSAAEITHADDDKNTSKIDSINLINLDSDDNDYCPTSAPLSLLGVKSKNIVCYSDSESDNSDDDIDVEIQEQNPKRSRIPVAKANVDQKIEPSSRLKLEDASNSNFETNSNQPSTSRQTPGQIQRMYSEDWKKDREKMWRKYF